MKRLKIIYVDKWCIGVNPQDIYHRNIRFWVNPFYFIKRPYLVGILEDVLGRSYHCHLSFHVSHDAKVFNMLKHCAL